jgi:glutathione S-transferase
MDVYFSPLACSLASRIVLYEAGADARFIEVDPKSKRTLDGDDYREIYPLGLVPLLRLDDGSLLRENAAILQYIAARYPHAELAPADAVERARPEVIVHELTAIPAAFDVRPDHDIVVGRNAELGRTLDRRAGILFADFVGVAPVSQRGQHDPGPMPCGVS